jgi:hypothetical protein
VLFVIIFVCRNRDLHSASDCIEAGSESFELKQEKGKIEKLHGRLV